MVRSALTALLLVSVAFPAMAQDVTDTSITALSADLKSGKTTSEAAVKAYLDRIAAMDKQGPKLNAVITIAPDALQQARARDADRKKGKAKGMLHGIPVLIKDNVETLGMPTTAGSLALKDNDNNRDAPVVAALRAQGAIILGKTNLSEWANIRSTRSMSGWSAIGGLTRNPYALNRTTCGSSSGSGAAVAAAFAPAAVGTETDGSVICPSSINGLVGLKPTIGLIPRTHIVPISHSQDTAGPMARTVRDTAILFSVMIASDPADAVTKDAGKYRRDYAAALAPDALKGMRVGVLRVNASPELTARFNTAIEVLKAQGAELVEVKAPDRTGLGDAEYTVLLVELKADLNSYLASTAPDKVKTRTLADLIAFNTANAAREMPLFGQEIFEEAQTQKGLDDPDYLAAREKSLRMAGKDGIDKMLADNNVQLIVTPSYGPAWLSDTVQGDQTDSPSASALPAISGYPHLTVPMGTVRGLPVGISFIGTAYSEQTLLNAGYAYEQAAGIQLRPTFQPTVDVGNELEGVGQ